MKDRIAAVLREAAAVHEALADQCETIERIGRRLADALAAGGTVYVMGNGGSAADAQHFAGEMVGRFLIDGRPPLPCVAFTTDSSVMTSIANDFSIDEIFAKQAEALVREGDALVAISTSGNSPNVVAALDVARERGALTVGLTGRDGGAMRGRCEMCLVVPAESTPRIQEAHGTVIHIWCGLIEDILYPHGPPDGGKTAP